MRHFLFAIVLFFTIPNVFAQNSVETEDLPRFLQLDNGIFRGGLPTEQGIRKLKEMGIKTIVNIENSKRRIEQEREWAQKYNLNFISLPMEWMVAPTDELVDEILKTIQDTSKQPVYLHCRHGKDRTGIVAGIYRVEIQGWSADKAYSEMLDIGFDPSFVALKNYYWQRVRR